MCCLCGSQTERDYQTEAQSYFRKKEVHLRHTLSSPLKNQLMWKLQTAAHGTESFLIMKEKSKINTVYKHMWYSAQNTGNMYSPNESFVGFL